MSNEVKQIGGAIIGGTIGFFVGGPAGALRGGLLGYSLGTSFTTTRLDEAQGPRVEQLGIQSADAGTPIKQLHGGDEFAGNIIWLKGNKIDEKEHREEVESGGKGGGGTKQTVISYTYSATFAVALTDRPTGGIAKIFADNVLIMDNTSTSVGTLAQSNENVDDITIFDESSNNEVSSLMQADLGSDIPAFRNLTRIEFENLQLGEFGNRIPVIRVVAYDDDSASNTDPDLLSAQTGGNTFPEGELNSATGANIYTMPTLYEDGVLTAYKIEKDAISITSGGTSYTNAPRIIRLQLNADDTSTLLAEDEIKIDLSTLPWTVNSTNLTTTQFYLFPIINDPAGRFIVTFLDTNSVRRTALTDLVNYIGLDYDSPPAISTDRFHYLRGEVYGISNSAVVRFGTSGVRLLPNPRYKVSIKSNPSNTYLGIGVDNVSGKLFATDTNNLYELNPDSLAILNTYALSTTAGVGDIIVAHEGLIISYHNGTNLTTVSLRTGSLVEIGTSSEDPVGTVLAINVSPFVFFLRTFGNPWSIPGSFNENYVRTGENFTNNANKSVANTILSVLDANPFISIEDIDISSISSESVGGYTTSDTSSAAARLKPLMQAYQFGVYEADYKIKFKSRVNATNTATITVDDLQAHELGQEQPDQALEFITADFDVPSRLNIIYRDTAKEFESNVQYAFRSNDLGTSAKDLNLPVSVDADKAAQVADILLNDAILEAKGTIRIRTNMRYSYVEREDLITVTTDNATYTLLVIDKEIGKPGLVLLDCTLVSVDNYTSTVSGESGQAISATLTPVSRTELLLVDTIPLRDADQDSGFYFAVYPRNPNGRWSGSTVAASRDAIQWTTVATMLNAVTYGTATDTLSGNQSSTIIDSSETLNIIMASGVLSTATEDQVRANTANVLVYGEAGRWEVMKFVTATLQGDGSYTISELIRGYWGTEHNMGNHEVGDSVILFSNSTIKRYNLNSDADFENAFSLIATTFNKIFQKSDIRTQVANAEALENRRPVHIKASRSSGDITFRWARQKLVAREWSEINWTETNTFNFEVDVLNGMGGAVLRTISASGSNNPITAAYSSADQITDFGSTQTAVYVNIYQIDPLTGRGVVGQGLGI